MAKVLGTLLLLAVAAAPLALFLRSPGAEDGAGGTGKARERPAVPVEVTPVGTGLMRDLLVLTGSLEPRSSFVLSSRVGARLEELRFHVGDRVKSGDLVASFEDDEHELAVVMARSEVRVASEGVEAARALLNLAKRDFERLQQLSAKNLASDADLDQVRGRREAQESDLKVKAAQLALREAALRAAEVRLGWTKVHAAWEGEPAERVVGERFAEPGAQLRANDPLLSILDLSSMVGVVFVIERDYARLKTGQIARVSTDAYPGRTFDGKVVRIAPLLRESSRQARVEIEIPNPERILKPGMFLRAELELDRRERALRVPLAALSTQGAGTAVFVLDENKAEARRIEIETGIREGDWVEARKPDRFEGPLVTIGHHLLRDGSKVLVQDPQTGGTRTRSRTRNGSGTGSGSGRTASGGTGSGAASGTGTGDGRGPR